MLELIINSEEGEKRYPLSSGEWTLGRSRDCDFQVSNKHVSGKHVQLIVTDDRVRVENLSRYGSTIGDRSLTTASEWPAGAILTLTKGVFASWKRCVPQDVPSFDVTEGIPAVSTDVAGLPENSARTLPPPQLRDEQMLSVRSDAGDAVKSRLNLSRMMNRHTVDSQPAEKTYVYDDKHGGSGTDSNTLQRDTGDSYDGTGHHTQGIHTRPADETDIKRMVDAGRRKRRNRLALLGVVVCLLVGSVAAYLLTHASHEETMILWPEDEHGNSLDRILDSPRGGYRVIVPDADTRLLRDEPDLRLIRCTLGRNKDIPFQIWIEKNESADNWMFSLQQLVDRWMADKVAYDHPWMFDDPLVGSLFAGGRGGIPFVFVHFTRRESNGSEWVGSARLFRSGMVFSVVRTEAPLRMRTRMSEMLAYLYIAVPDEYVDRHWEPVAINYDSGTALQSLNKAVEMGVQRDAPAYWTEVLCAFREALTLAARDGDIATTHSALSALANFRNRQQLFYNRQWAAFESAVRRNDRDGALAVKQLCMSAFADHDDARFHRVRRWRLP